MAVALLSDILLSPLNKVKGKNIAMQYGIVWYSGTVSKYVHIINAVYIQLCDDFIGYIITFKDGYLYIIPSHIDNTHTHTQR